MPSRIIRGGDDGGGGGGGVSIPAAGVTIHGTYEIVAGTDIEITPYPEQGRIEIASTAAVSGGGPPTGAVVMWTDPTPPTGYLLCDGSAVSRTTYADLFAVIGTDYGAGDGASTFNLPNIPDMIV